MRKQIDGRDSDGFSIFWRAPVAGRAMQTVHVEPFRAPLTVNHSDVLFQSKISEEILTEESNNTQIDKNRYEDTNN